jgi:O-methyltransferase involved in polyketide biosynthesis
MSKEKQIMNLVIERAKVSGTPFLSLWSPEEILSLAESSGFKSIQYISADTIYKKYFLQRKDNLKAGNAEAFLLATT